MNLINEIQNKIEKYKIINPLEYISIIRTCTDFIIGKAKNFTIYFNNDICFSVYTDPINLDCIEAIYVSMSLNSTDNTKDNFNYLGRITINSNDNNLRILNNVINDTLVLYKSIYEAYTKNKKAKIFIDFLSSIDILIIDHKNKCICVRR